MSDDVGSKSRDETQQRQTKILRGAFSGPPTQLKDIPKKRVRKKAAQTARSRRAPKHGAD